MKRMTASVVTLLLLFSLLIPASAASDSAMRYDAGVTQEMTYASYWHTAKDEIQMTATQLKAYLKSAQAVPETGLVDLYAVSRSYDASALKSAFLSEMALAGIPQELIGAFEKTALTGEKLFLYAICTADTMLYAYPRDNVAREVVGTLQRNEPFLVKQQCVLNDKTYYWGQSDHASGWLNAATVAVCGDRAAWNDAFSVQTGKTNFIVVTSDMIESEQTVVPGAVSGQRFSRGTVLKLVPEAEKANYSGLSAETHRYAVFVPTRTSGGQYEKKISLLAQNSGVSCGYLPLKPSVLLQLAFQSLGTNMMNDAAFLRSLYRCCGLQLPQTAACQNAVVRTKVSLADKAVAQKKAFLQNLPAGSLLYSDDQAMLYCGMSQGNAYVIARSERDSVQLRHVSSLQSLVSAVIPAEYNGHTLKTVFERATPEKPGKNVVTCLICGAEIENRVIASPRKVRLSTAEVVYNGKEKTPKVQVTDSSGKTIDAKYYTVKYGDNTNVGKATVTVKFKGLYSGTLTKQFRIIPKGTAIMSVQTSENRLIVTWKKQAKQTDGYELMYAKNDAFSKGVKSVRISDPKQTYIMIDHFKGKTCCLRIRTFHKEGKRTVYSDWSETTKVLLA